MRDKYAGFKQVKENLAFVSGLHLEELWGKPIDIYNGLRWARKKNLKTN